MTPKAATPVKRLITKQMGDENYTAVSEARPAGSGIFIKEVRIRNFRCLLSVDVELDKLTVLIGQNNSGKTSFLNALFAAIGAGQRIISNDDILLRKGEISAPKDRAVVVDILIRPTDDQGKITSGFPTGSPWLELWGILANPRDRLHLGILAKAWKVALEEINRIEETLDSAPLKIIQTLVEKARGGSAPAVMDAITAMRWTGDDFKFGNALGKIEEFASTLSEEDRELIFQDSNEWRKHWDYYIRSEPAGARSITSFLGQVALGTTQQPKDDGLALLTVHSAKGMEFDVVFIIGMAEGTFPDYRAKGRALEEERRSAFVAVTRSKRLLYLTYPKTKLMSWGAVKVQQPSLYISELFE